MIVVGKDPALYNKEKETERIILNQYANEKWLGREPQFDIESITETENTDIIVVGGGLAGVAAARQAAELGEKVILFEKCRCIQARSGDFAVMDSKAAKRWGREKLDKAAITNDLMQDMAYKASQNILRRWAEEAGEAFDWYMDGMEGVEVLDRTDQVPSKGVKCYIQPRRLPLPVGFDNGKERFKCYQVTAWVRPSHIPMCVANFERAMETGNLISYFNTRVEKLLRQPGSRVEGVIARTAEGTLKKTYANKGVILATGDYMNDKEMLKRFLPGMTETPKQWTSYLMNREPSNTGDGHKMALWAGAKLQDSPHAPMAHHMGSVFGVSDFLLLDTRGKRFVNEDAPGQQIGSQIENLADKTAWQIVDGNWREDIPREYPSHGNVCFVTEDETLENGSIYDKLCFIDNYIAPKYIEQNIEEGKLIRAETLDELIDKIGLPKEEALASIQRYNRMCHQKKDTDYGKEKERLFAVEKAPFYAAKFTPAVMIAALGGIQSDEDAHCYDTEGKMIPGLYAAGNVQGNRVAVDYPLTVPGLSHSMALVYGRIAARNLAEGI